MSGSLRLRVVSCAFALVVLSGLVYGRLRPTTVPDAAGDGARVFVVRNHDDAGAGSLRQAILDANASPNTGAPDRIHFAIGGRGERVIAVLSPLPVVTEPLFLDGLTQPGARANTVREVAGPAAVDAAVLIVIDGAQAGEADGLVLQAGGSTIRGIALRSFVGNGIRIEGRGHNVVESVRIGDGPAPASEDGQTADARSGGNGTCGIAIIDSSENVVGGLEPCARNVIRANGDCAVRITGAASVGNTIIGNAIADNARGIVLGEGGDTADSGDVDTGP